MIIRQDVFKWFDQDGLLGREENPSPGEEGNPISETSIAYIFLKLLGLSESNDATLFSDTIERLKTKNGFYVKKARTNDDLVSDDIIPLCAASRILKTWQRFAVYQKGVKTGFKYSTDWGGILKPWQIAFIVLSIDGVTSIWESIYFTGSIIFDALFTQQNDPSSKRLTWCQMQSLNGKSFFIDLISRFWVWRVNARYGNLSRIFVAFYGEEHINAKMAVQYYEGRYGL